MDLNESALALHRRKKIMYALLEEPYIVLLKTILRLEDLHMQIKNRSNYLHEKQEIEKHLFELHELRRTFECLESGLCELNLSRNSPIHLVIE